MHYFYKCYIPIIAIAEAKKAVKTNKTSIAAGMCFEEPLKHVITINSTQNVHPIMPETKR